MQATVLRENEEKVIVEETFQPKTSPGEENGKPGEPPNGQPPSSLEKLVVKLEQSINIFLTVYFLFLLILYSPLVIQEIDICLSFQDSVIRVLDTLYHDRDYPRFFVLETIARVPYFGKC